MNRHHSHDMQESTSSIPAIVIIHMKKFGHKRELAVTPGWRLMSSHASENITIMCITLN